MKLTLKEIARKIDGEVIGDDAAEIHGVTSFNDAGPGEITFASDIKFLNLLKESKAGAVIVPSDFEVPVEEVPIEKSAVQRSIPSSSLPSSSLSSSSLSSSSFFVKSNKLVSLIKTENPKRQFFRILRLFHPPVKSSETVAAGVIIGKKFIAGTALTLDSNVTIGSRVKLGDRVHIMPGVYIGDNVVIGDDVLIKPNVTVMEGTIIGSRVLIHSGSVIGSDGFGFTSDVSTGHEKIPHAGYVHIEDDVEIGACNTIDRGTFGLTRIARGVKTDNLVHIAHNVTVGDHSLIVAQAGIAGSTVIGKGVILAGKAGISGHLKIGDGAVVGPGAGVLSDVKPGNIVSGIPEMPHKLWLKVGKILPRLPELRKKIFALEKKMANAGSENESVENKKK